MSGVLLLGLSALMVGGAGAGMGRVGTAIGGGMVTPGGAAAGTLGWPAVPGFGRTVTPALGAGAGGVVGREGVVAAGFAGVWRKVGDGAAGFAGTGFAGCRLSRARGSTVTCAMADVLDSKNPRRSIRVRMCGT